MKRPLALGLVGLVALLAACDSSSGDETEALLAACGGAGGDETADASIDVAAGVDGDVDADSDRGVAANRDGDADADADSARPSWPQYEENPFVFTASVPAPEDTAGSVIVSDLDGDGLLDFVMSGRGRIAAHGHDGAELWVADADVAVTSESETNGLPGHHGPGVQAGDVDGDGVTEVVFLTHDGSLHVLDGPSGTEEWSATPPPPPDADRWEHAVIATLGGETDQDVVLQASTGSYRLGRLVAAFSFDDLETAPSGEATPLWSVDDFFPLAHGGVRVADLDGDGLDEILGGCILGPDGISLYRLPMSVERRPHLDSIFVADVVPADPGLEVVALQEGDGRVRLRLRRDRAPLAAAPQQLGAPKCRSGRLRPRPGGPRGLVPEPLQRRPAAFCLRR